MPESKARESTIYGEFDFTMREIVFDGENRIRKKYTRPLNEDRRK